LQLTETETSFKT